MARLCLSIFFVLCILLAIFFQNPGFYLVTVNPHLEGFGPFMLSTAERRDAFNYDQLEEGSLNGKVALVTGANIGLGYYTSLHLARKGATVVMACRSFEKCEVAAEEIRLSIQKPNTAVIPMVVDVSSLGSVEDFTKKFSELYQRLDIFVQNAGVGVSAQHLSVDGVEMVYATNHLGHFKMFKDLEPLLLSTEEKNKDVRIVLVSSAGHFASNKIHFSLEEINDKSNFDGLLGPYSHTKLANVLFSNALAARFSKKNIYVNSLHPGGVATNIWEPIMEVQKTLPFWIQPLVTSVWEFTVKYVFWTSEEGALTQTFLAASPQVKSKDIRGRYFHQIVKEVAPNPLALDVSLQRGLWEFSEKLLKEKGF